MRKLLIPLLLISFQAHSTTIIVVIKNKTITIGADALSLTTGVLRDQYGNRLRDTLIKHQVCKIARINNMFFAGAGYDIEQMKGFIRPILLKSRRISVSIQSIKQTLTDSLNKLIELVRVNNPSIYKSKCEQKVFANSVICMFENGHPVVYEIAAATASRYYQKVKVDILIKKHLIDDIIPLGHTTFIDSDLRKWRTWETDSISMNVYRLVEKQATNDKDWVGPPITIVQITNKGYKTIFKGLCSL